MSFDDRYKGDGPTFGQMVRALRLGFYWLHDHGCFMRLSGNGPFKCELEPCGLIPNSRKCEAYRQFWPSPDNRVILDVNQIAIVRHLRRVKRPFAFYFDDNGNRL